MSHAASADAVVVAVGEKAYSEGLGDNPARNCPPTFTVANTGSRAGTDVVPMHVHQPVSAVLVPDQRLVGFARWRWIPASPRPSRSPSRLRTGGDTR